MALVESRVRRSSVLIVSGCVVAVVGCGSSSASTEPAPVATSATTQAAPEVAAPSAPAAVATPTAPTPPPEPAPTVSVRIEEVPGSLARTPSVWTVTIANEGSETARFASRLVLERVENGEGHVVTSPGPLVAMLDEAHPLPECAELVRGALLELPFPALAEAAAGDYRVVVTSCNGTGRVEAAPFTID